MRRAAPAMALPITAIAEDAVTGAPDLTGAAAAGVVTGTSGTAFITIIVRCCSWGQMWHGMAQYWFQNVAFDMCNRWSYSHGNQMHRLLMNP